MGHRLWVKGGDRGNGLGLGVKDHGLLGRGHGTLGQVLHSFHY